MLRHTAGPVEKDASHSQSLQIIMKRTAPVLFTVAVSCPGSHAYAHISQMCLRTAKIPATGRLRQEDRQFEAPGLQYEFQGSQGQNSNTFFQKNKKANTQKFYLQSHCSGSHNLIHFIILNYSSRSINVLPILNVQPTQNQSLNLLIDDTEFCHNFFYYDQGRGRRFQCFLLVPFYIYDPEYIRGPRWGYNCQVYLQHQSYEILRIWNNNHRTSHHGVSDCLEH